MKRAIRRGLLVIGTIVLIVAAGVLISRRSQAVLPEGEVVVVMRGDIEESVREVGSIEPLRKVELKSKVAGQVTEVLVDVGSVVKAGDVLVKLDPRDAERQLGLGAAEQKVTMAQLRRAETELSMKGKAHSLGAISDLELSAASGEVKRLQAQRGVDSARLRILRDQVGYTKLQSPIDGVVLARSIQPGEMVTPGVAAMVDGKPLLVVAQLDRLLVRTELNQLDVTRIRSGDKVSVSVDALPGKSFQGEVFRIASMAQRSERRKDSNLQVFPVDVVVDTAQPQASRLRPGMMADIRIDVATHKGVLSLPLEALVYEKGKVQVRKVDLVTKREQLVDVVVGARNGQVAEIVSGIDEGMSVLVRPAAPGG